MPELPELEVVRRRLTPHLEGRVVEDVVVPPRLGFLLRASLSDLEALRGARIAAIRRRGKFLLLDIGDSHLVVNPMLGGRFALTTPGDRVAASTVLRLLAGDGTELRFTDSVRMGRVYVVGSGHLDGVPQFADLGPEANEIDAEEFARRIRRHPGELKNLLRNQAFVAGIGNAYSDEILHRAQLLPLRKRTTLGAEDITRLHGSVGAVLEEAITAIEAQPGYRMQDQDRSFMAVHGKGGQPCPRCGHRISELTARGEITNFCRGCQR